MIGNHAMALGVLWVGGHPPLQGATPVVHLSPNTVRVRTACLVTAGNRSPGELKLVGKVDQGKKAHAGC